MKKLSFIAVWLLALAAIACALLVYEKAFLWKVQEMNLFLNTSLYFKQQMVVSGGLLTYVGTFFTQFLHHPLVGVLLLCAWWLLLMGLVKRTFQVPDKWAALMLIPVALLLLTIVDMGYWVYFLKLRGHFFVATIGCTAVVALLWCFRSLPKRYYLRTIFLLVVAAASYPLMGIYGLASVLLMAVWSWRIEPRSKAIINSVLALVCLVAIPLLYYRQVYHETNLSNIYYTALPLYYLRTEYHQYYIPYYLLLLYFVVMAFIPWSRTASVEVANQKPTEAVEPQPLKKGKKQQPKKTKQGKAGKRSFSDSKWHRFVAAHGWTIGIVALLAIGVFHFWYKDSNFHRELRMQLCIDKLDWEGVVEEAAAQEEEPTRAIVMMKNLALFRLGRQSTEMYNFRNGSKRSTFPKADGDTFDQDTHFDVRMMQVIGMLIYYQYGKLNDCARLSMEMGVEYDWRAEYYKYLVRCAILDGDKPLAKKYIHILKQTTFFRDWAAWAENLLNHPDQIAKDPETEPITHMLHYANELSSDHGFVEEYLMKHLARSGYTGDPVFQEQCLLASMWLKDSRYFWYHFNNYVRLHPNADIPLYYQQAAYTFGVEGNHPNLDHMPFDPGVKESFEKFSQEASKHDGLDIEEARELLYPLYGKTYYYDFYLMSNLPQY